MIDTEVLALILVNIPNFIGFAALGYGLWRVYQGEREDCADIREDHVAEREMWRALFNDALRRLYQIQAENERLRNGKE